MSCFIRTLLLCMQGAGAAAKYPTSSRGWVGACNGVMRVSKVPGYLQGGSHFDTSDAESTDTFRLFVVLKHFLAFIFNLLFLVTKITKMCLSICYLFFIFHSRKIMTDRHNTRSHTHTRSYTGASFPTLVPLISPCFSKPVKQTDPDLMPLSPFLTSLSYS